jgi:hypothetical protein
VLRRCSGRRLSGRQPERLRRRVSMRNKHLRSEASIVIAAHAGSIAPDVLRPPRRSHLAAVVEGGEPVRNSTSALPHEGRSE